MAMESSAVEEQIAVIGNLKTINHGSTQQKTQILFEDLIQEFGYWRLCWACDEEAREALYRQSCPCALIIYILNLNFTTLE